MRDFLSRLLGAVMCLAGIAVVVGSAWLAYRSGDWAKAVPASLGIVVFGLGWRRFNPDYFAPLPVAKDDPLMLAAIDQARDEIERFKAGLHDDATQAFVKFPLTSPGGDTEHIWGLVHEQSGGELTVSLANDPVEDQGELDAHERVAFERLEDWMLVGATGDTEGGYTVGAIAAIYKRDRGRVPPPIKAQLRQFKDIDLDNLE
ncbi:MAG: DUF2314 domain-containing protein [Pseudomonadota bacterium]